MILLLPIYPRLKTSAAEYTIPAASSGSLVFATKRKTNSISLSYQSKDANRPIADVIILYTKTRPEAGSRGITAFIFETKTPGFAVARKLQKLGMHGSPTGELVFEDAFVPAENVLGKIDEGFKVVMSGLDIERAFYAVSMVGGLEAALEMSIKYAKEREQFGQPIANFQLIQAKLADMYTD